MPSPFPGIDPYLESPELWPDVHHRLISEIQSTLNQLLRPRYVARVELRVYISDDDDPGRVAIIPDLRVEKGPKSKLEMKPFDQGALAIAEPIIIPLLLDDEIREARLEILHPESNSLVTIIELLSPTNKIRGSRGRASFLEKRRDTLASDVHWVELDLLRAGYPSVPRPKRRACDYSVLVSRASDHARAKYWPISVRHELPTFGIPLRDGDSDVLLELNAVLKRAYDHGAYDLSIDYSRDPIPPLNPKDAAWADTLLREHGLRKARGSKKA